VERTAVIDDGRLFYVTDEDEDVHLSLTACSRVEALFDEKLLFQVSRCLQSRDSGVRAGSAQAGNAEAFR
jgi:hypothetical protein